MSSLQLGLPFVLWHEQDSPHRLWAPAGGGLSAHLRRACDSVTAEIAAL